MALIAIDALKEKDIDLMVRTFQQGQWGRFPSLGFLRSYLGRQSVWPPTENLSLYGKGVRWCTQDFFHDANFEKSYYQRISIRPVLRKDDTPFLVFHVAYRQEGLFAGRWLQFGYLIRTPGYISLFHINGETQQHCLEEDGMITNFETYFGPDSAHFRIASIHQFGIELVENGDSASTTVRFR